MAITKLGGENGENGVEVNEMRTRVKVGPCFHQADGEVAWWRPGRPATLTAQEALALLAHLEAHKALLQEVAADEARYQEVA